MYVKNAVSMAESELSVLSFSKMLIGEDVMMANHQMIYSGDGHPIFVKDENGNYKLINDCTKDFVEIGDHVWIGYGSKVLSGSKIGSGSIVGAGSLVNKKFPNNVLIVGSPAKIIKRNVAWCRNVLFKDISRDEKVFENYVKDTIEE